MTDTPITDARWEEAQGTDLLAHRMSDISRELERVANQLADALKWYHYGEPLPTLADKALAAYEAMKKGTT